MNKEELINEINRLRKEQNAVILAHNYQRPEIQDLADYLGDSLELAKAATKVDCQIIVFCGVHFMAESAKILNPEKTVLLPDLRAGCPLADSATAEQVREARRKHPDALTIAYINTSAAVKAEVDICCTSSNALNIFEKFKDKSIIYLPDKNLAAYAKKLLNKDDIISWPGWCYVHETKITLEKLDALLRKFPDAHIVAHPECHLEVLEKAHHVASTSGIVKHVSETDYETYIILTETGLGYQIEQKNPGKRIIMVNDGICYNMKVTTLRGVYEALRDMKHQIEVPEEIRLRAKKALDRMLEVV